MVRRRSRNTTTRRKYRPSPQDLLALMSAKDLDGFIDAAFDVLRAAVEFDFATAFYRNAGDGLLKARDSLRREYSAALMRRHVELNPAIPLAMANRGIKILTTRTGLPGSNEELRRTAFYHEIMQPLGWRHSVGLCFWGTAPAELPIFVISTDRSEDKPDFSQHDVDVLAELHPFFDCTVNRLFERETAENVRDGFAFAVGDGTRGVAVLDRHFALVEANHVACQISAAWVDEGEPFVQVAPGAWRLPPVLLAACRTLHHEWQSNVHANPDAAGVRRQRRVIHPHVPGLAATVTMVCPSTSLATPTFVLEFDRNMPGASLGTADQAVHVLSRLTASERAIALVLADGCSNQEIADRLGKTLHAVKFHLHKVYEKTGISNRAALVAVLRSRLSDERADE